MFAGSPPKESEREEAFKRRLKDCVCAVEAGAEAGLPISLQNHNHGALARTGDDVLRFVREVNGLTLPSFSNGPARWLRVGLGDHA